jgi:hypothetical protein
MDGTIGFVWSLEHGARMIQKVVIRIPQEREPSVFTFLSTQLKPRPDPEWLLRRGLCLALLILLSPCLVGCGGTVAMTSSTPQLTALEVSPQNSTIALGQTMQFKATGEFSDGSSKDETSTAVWTSSDSGVASVAATGLATSLSVGNARMTASVGTISGSTALAVAKSSIVSIAIDPSALSIPLGAAAQLKATATYTDKSTQDVTNSVTWATSQPDIAVVSSSGLTASKSVGAASITATSGSINASCKLNVLPPALASIAVEATRSTIPLGATAQLTAVGTYTNGSAQNLTKSVTWSSASDLVVSVSSTGVADARKLGTSVVTAATAGISGSITLTASPAALTSISISPANPAIPLTASLQLAATGTFTDGSTQNLTSSATWEVVNAAIVSVSGAGGATALEVGSTAVDATLAGITGSTTITVQPIAAVSYFTAGQANADTTLRITNPGASGGNLCAMVYVFDQDQQMAECCGCRISPDGLRTLSFNKDLTANPLTDTPTTTGTVMLVTADYASNPACNAASITPTGLGIAWATHLQAFATETAVTSEESLSQTPLSATVSAALQSQCLFIQQLGSGRGICSCGSGD